MPSDRDLICFRILILNYPVIRSLTSLIVLIKFLYLLGAFKTVGGTLPYKLISYGMCIHISDVAEYTLEYKTLDS